MKHRYKPKPKNNHPFKRFSINGRRVGTPTKPEEIILSDNKDVRGETR